MHYIVCNYNKKFLFCKRKHIFYNVLELTRSLETLEWYVKSKYLKMKLHTLRSNTQLGLIRARMFGARHASGNLICAVLKSFLMLVVLVTDTQSKMR